MEKRKISLSAGDHIFIQRSIHYSHHGIFVGDDKVIHYQTPMEKGYPDPSMCHVIESDLETFLDQDEELYLYRYGVSEDKAKLYPKGTYTSKPCDAPHVVVERAKRSISEGFSHYNIVGNNCEDFATYCKTGQRSTESAQFSAALECVAAARRAVDQGYRSPLVYAGCVFGMFTARDFKSPPKNYIPSTPEADGLDNEIVNDGAKSSNDKMNGKEGNGMRDKEAKADNNSHTYGINGYPVSNACAKKIESTRNAKPKRNVSKQPGISKTVNFDLTEANKTNI